MQIFTCPGCGSPVYFHNTTCGCGQAIFFDPDRQIMQGEGPACVNREMIGCNWVAEAGNYCRSCAMTETVPDLAAPENVPLWTRTELNKRWLLASLTRWGWFTPDDHGARPVFKLLSEQTAAGDYNVVMGHANGVITINVSEASEAVRKQRQINLGESYRTMIGHMRHEVAHFLFLRVAQDDGFLPAFRDLFGDERENYAEALKEHYNHPDAPDAQHITSYATAHPHEDWAETIAHLLHLVDLLDSAAAARLSLPSGPSADYDAYVETDAVALVKLAADVALAVNHVNRALDLPDLYPFVLGAGVREKLVFAHRYMQRVQAA
ncbi:hypothetical protein SAMN04490244_10317 [Tranquillimonas rosea]|uniref:Uncharacterized protein n=1 Tax=Tranquillimonas rosea TaxID=641238 RepID=A0A1H9S4F3_9RHOB|nr:putative zinc-binding metallopeptidase [Tranquillimonas rosea]SER79844.1 hypothetical protein SAMN04490244_10317 [Tranquillimonas rosea]